VDIELIIGIEGMETCRTWLREHLAE